MIVLIFRKTRRKKLRKRIIFFGIITLLAVLVLAGCPGIGPESVPDPAIDPVTYTVTYDGNSSDGGTVSADNNSYEQGATVTVASSGTMTRSGYTFSGWNTASDGTGTGYAAGAVFVMGTVDVTLYAKWGVAVTQETYTAGGVSFTMSYVLGDHTFPTGPYDSGTATVTDAYWIGETEVTYELWSTVYTWATSNGYYLANVGRRGGGTGNTDQHPVTTINWRDTMVWSNAVTEWYNARKGTSYSCVYTDGGTPIRDSRNSNATQCDGVTPDGSATGFRLLTSDEWELAARWRNDSVNTVSGYSDPWFTKGNSASGATRHSDDNTNGSGEPGKSANDAVAVYKYYWDGSSWDSKGTTGTAVVKSLGSGSANSQGLYDMSGNVWEWCFDLDLTGLLRVMRGGSWDIYAPSLDIGRESSFDSDGEMPNIGFRVSRTP
jgi:uncharacterized repeat protein (TIGR02543 family)